MSVALTPARRRSSGVAVCSSELIANSLVGGANGTGWGFFEPVMDVGEGKQRLLRRHDRQPGAPVSPVSDGVGRPPEACLRVGIDRVVDVDLDDRPRAVGRHLKHGHAILGRQRQLRARAWSGKWNVPLRCWSIQSGLVTANSGVKRWFMCGVKAYRTFSCGISSPVR